MPKVVAGSGEGVLTKELLHSLLSYDAATGVLSWKKRSVHLPQAGKKCLNSDMNHKAKYARGRIQVLGMSYTTSRVIHIMHHGPIPEGMHIDHINGNPVDNRIENLRLVTRFQNMKNRRQRKPNRSGYKGVFEHGAKWRAELQHEGKRIRSKDFPTPLEAALAYDEILYNADPVHASLNFPKEHQLSHG